MRALRVQSRIILWLTRTSCTRAWYVHVWCKGVHRSMLRSKITSTGRWKLMLQRYVSLESLCLVTTDYSYEKKELFCMYCFKEQFTATHLTKVTLAKIQTRLSLSDLLQGIQLKVSQLVKTNFWCCENLHKPKLARWNICCKQTVSRISQVFSQLFIQSL